MTGQGTQSDPIIIESWSEFKTSSIYGGASTVYYKIKDNTVWDMNILEPSGDCPRIFIESAYDRYIDGNGVVIKNLRLNSNPFFYLNSSGKFIISNFVMENIYGQNNLLYFATTSNSWYCTFNDCIITGFFTQPIFKYSTSTYNNARRVYLNRCGVDIDIMGKTAFHYRMPFVFNDSYCKLKYYNDDLPEVLGDYNSSYLPATVPKFNNTFVDIDINNCTNGGLISIYISSDSTNSIYNIKSPTSSGTFLNVYDSGNCLVLLNSSLYKANSPLKMPNTSVYSWESFPSIKRLTDDQMKSPSFIRSIGFPIGGD